MSTTVLKRIVRFLGLVGLLLLLLSNFGSVFAQQPVASFTLATQCHPGYFANQSYTEFVFANRQNVTIEFTGASTISDGYYAVKNDTPWSWTATATNGAVFEDGVVTSGSGVAENCGLLPASVSVDVVCVPGENGGHTELTAHVDHGMVNVSYSIPDPLGKQPPTYTNDWLHDGETVTLPSGVGYSWNTEFDSGYTGPEGMARSGGGQSCGQRLGWLDIYNYGCLTTEEGDDIKYFNTSGEGIQVQAGGEWHNPYTYFVLDPDITVELPVQPSQGFYYLSDTVSVSTGPAEFCRPLATANLNIQCVNDGTGLSQSTLTADTYSADIRLDVFSPNVPGGHQQYDLHDGDQTTAEGAGYYQWQGVLHPGSTALDVFQGSGYFGCETTTASLTFQCVPDGTTSSHTEVTVNGANAYMTYNGDSRHHYWLAISELTDYYLQVYAYGGYRFPDGMQTVWEGTTESCHLAPADASFAAAPIKGVAPLTVTFTPVATHALSLLWDFGDGVTDTLNLNPTHLYATSGIYTPTFTITTAGGTDTKEGSAIYVYSPANATFTASPLIGTTPLTVTFTPVTTDTALSLLWDFGDGKTDSANMHPTHVYTPAGVYTPTFTITTAGGTDTRTGQAITVNKVVVPTSEVYLPLILK